MKKYDFLSKMGKHSEFSPLVLRFFMGLVFVLAGYTKLNGIAGVTNFFGNIGIPMPGLFAWVVALAEFIGGLALIIGLLTRYFALVHGFIMVVALLTAKVGGGTVEGVWSLTAYFQGARLDFMLFAAAISLVITGAGKYSLDKMLLHKKHK